LNNGIRAGSEFGAELDALKGSFGPFQIHSGHNVPLKLTLVAL
jgi:hypothetical protein